MAKQTEIEKFNFFRSYFEGIKRLPESEQLTCYREIMNFMFENEIPEKKSSCFAFIEHHLNQTKGKIEAGSTGGKISKRQAEPKQTLSRRQANAKQQEQEQELEIKEKIIKKEIFKKPTSEDVKTYLIEEKELPFPRARDLAEKFVNFYESKGWKVGKSSMVSWKSAIALWIARDSDNKPTPIKTGFADQEQRDRDEEEGRLQREKIIAERGTTVGYLSEFKAKWEAERGVKLF